MPSSQTYFRRGEDHVNARLTDARVRHIRRSGESIDVLARAFGVGRSAIHRARTGETWQHVPGATRGSGK